MVGQLDQPRPCLGGGGDCLSGQRRIAGSCPRRSVGKCGERRIPRWRRLGQPKKLWMQISLARSGGGWHDNASVPKKALNNPVPELPRTEKSIIRIALRAPPRLY